MLYKQFHPHYLGLKRKINFTWGNKVMEHSLASCQRASKPELMGFKGWGIESVVGLRRTEGIVVFCSFRCETVIVMDSVFISTKGRNNVYDRHMTDTDIHTHTWPLSPSAFQLTNCSPPHTTLIYTHLHSKWPLVDIMFFWTVSGCEKGNAENTTETGPWTSHYTTAFSYKNRCCTVDAQC